jgi:hypothetical protein
MLPDRSFAPLFEEEANDPTTGLRRKTIRPPEEQRAQPRIPHEARVMVVLDGTPFNAVLQDISEGGVFLATHRAVPLGSMIAIDVPLPTGPVIARGIVRWSRLGSEGKLPGIGVAFEEIPRLDRERVASFCGDRPRFFTYDEILAATSA